jgi:hypothetical protein
MKRVLSILASATIATSHTATPALTQALTDYSPKPLYAQDTQREVVECVIVDRQGREEVNRDSPDAMISAGGRAFRPYGKLLITSEPHQETCNLVKHPSSEKMSEAVAIPDNSTLLRMRVSILVDGREKVTRIISRGEYRKFTFSVKGADSYSVIMTNVSGSYANGGYIYFVPVNQPD